MDIAVRNPVWLWVAVGLTVLAVVLAVLVVFDDSRIDSGFALTYAGAVWLARRDIRTPT